MYYFKFIISLRTDKCLDLQYHTFWANTCVACNLHIDCGKCYSLKTWEGCVVSMFDCKKEIPGDRGGTRQIAFH